MSKLDRLGTIDDVENIHFFHGSDNSQIISSHELAQVLGDNSVIGKIDVRFQTEFSNIITRLLDDNSGEISLIDLEKSLIDNFSTQASYIDGNEKIGFANCFAWPDTQIHRNSENIILPNGETPMLTKTNIGSRVIDPIGWSSKSIAPSGGYNNGKPEGYGIMGKVPALRPMDEKFDLEIYKALINTRFSLENAGVAIESGPQEVAVMPTFKIIGGEDIIHQFSEKRQKTDIQTAKHYGINL